MDGIKKWLRLVPTSLKNQYGRQYEIPIVIMVVGIVTALIGPRIIEWMKQYGQECSQIPLHGFPCLSWD